MSIQKAIDKISQENPKWQFDIVDVETGNTLHDKLTKEKVLQSYNSIEEFIKDFGDRKYKTIQIQYWRPNGSALRREKVVHEITFKSKKKEAIVHTQKNQIPGLNGFGLNGADILNLNAKATNYDIIRQELLETKSELKNTKAEKEALKDEIQNLKINQVTSQKNIFESPVISEMVKSFAPLIAKAAVAKTAPVGLNGVDENLPDYKISFIEEIKKEEYNSEILVNAYLTMKGLLTNPNFKNELTMLFDLHKVTIQKAV